MFNKNKIKEELLNEQKQMAENVKKAQMEIQAICDKYNVRLNVGQVIQIIPNIKK